MDIDNFKEWVQSFVDHYNYMSSRLPKPYKIGYRCALVKDTVYIQAIDLFYQSLSGTNTTVFYRERLSIPAGSSNDSENDWTEMMQRIVIEMMTLGSAKMIETANSEK